MLHCQGFGIALTTGVSLKDAVYIAIASPGTEDGLPPGSREFYTPTINIRYKS